MTADRTQDVYVVKAKSKYASGWEVQRIYSMYDEAVDWLNEEKELEKVDECWIERFDASADMIYTITEEVLYS